MRPKFCQAGQLVFQLRKFYLEAPFARPGVQRKDVKNQSTAIDNLDAEDLFEATLLGW